MLSRSERRRLEEIERGLDADDPALARALRCTPTHNGSEIGFPSRRRCLAGAVVALLLLVVSALSGSTTGMLLCAAATVVALLLRRGTASGPPRPGG